MPRALPISFYLVLFFGLVAGNISIYNAIFAPRILQISILDVEKGDAILVRTPNRKTLLIDTGPNASILRALGTALPEWQRHIDAIALTSEKTSSVGGLPDVASRYRIPIPIRFGTETVPYGTRLAFDNVFVAILSPGTLSINYDATSLIISSSTPAGVFISDGKTFTKR